MPDDEPIQPDPGATPAPVGSILCEGPMRRAYTIPEVVPVAGIAVLVAFLFGVALTTCNRRAAPVLQPQPASIQQQAAAVDAYRWAHAVHGPRLFIRGLDSTIYQEVELAGDWIKSLRVPALRWLMPVTVGPNDPRQVGGMYCLVDDAQALAYMQRWLAQNPAPVPAVKP